MSGLDSIDGAVAPLFDRLRAAKSGAESQPLRAMNPRELRASVGRELEWLLGTRSPTPAERFMTAHLTVVDYGLPDTSAFSPRSSDDQLRLAAFVTRAVAAFEPRLREVEAVVAPHPEDVQAVVVTLRARLLDELVTVALIVSPAGAHLTAVDVDVEPPDADQPVVV